MKARIFLAAGGLGLAALTACTHSGADKVAEQTAPAAARILLEDPMTGDWRRNWFLDGKKVRLEPGENGLYFESGPVTKAQDPVEYHAHHGVLWTRQEFEGDIGIRYELTRVSPGFTSLLYIQARGIGVPPYEEDIHAWRELRDIPAMDKYFKYMNLISLSFRGEIRARRYPWMDEARGIRFEDALIEPMLDYDRFPPGKTYLIDVEKRTTTLTLRVQELGKPENRVERTWDLTENIDPQRPPLSRNGRIGFRNMGGTKVIYRNVQVRRL